MQRKTIEAYSVRTIDWFENKVVDWNSAGTQYLENGEKVQLHKYHHGFVSGNQNSSIIYHLEDLPKIALNKKTKQIAIAKGNTIEILSD